MLHQFLWCFITLCPDWSNRAREIIRFSCFCLLNTLALFDFWVFFVYRQSLEEQLYMRWSETINKLLLTSRDWYVFLRSNLNKNLNNLVLEMGRSWGKSSSGYPWWRKKQRRMSHWIFTLSCKFISCWTSWIKFLRLFSNLIFNCAFACGFFTALMKCENIAMVVEQFRKQSYVDSMWLDCDFTCILFHFHFWSLFLCACSPFGGVENTCDWARRVWSM